MRAVEVGGLPLGTALSAQLPYREVVERLEPGDMLVLSSDGIVEAMNERGELYGFERFAEAIARGPATSAAMLAHLFADVAAFTGAAVMHDDMAIVVACYREAAGQFWTRTNADERGRLCLWLCLFLACAQPVDPAVAHRVGLEVKRLAVRVAGAVGEVGD